MGPTEYPHPINAGNYNCNNGMECQTNVGGARNTTANENLEIRRRLSPRDLMGRHEVVCAGRVDTRRNWLLETKESHEWVGEVGGADKDVLFGDGNSGVDNTYLR